MGEGIHDGHRERMKARFLKEGLSHFERYQVVEMLLYFGVPRKDTNELAHRLMTTFGTLTRLLEAPYDELCRIEGVTPNVAMLISFSGQLAREYYNDRSIVGTILNTTEEAGKYIVPKFMGLKNEAVLLVCMDNRCRVLNCDFISEGNVVSADISTRLIMQQALRFNATALILAHNHPNGHAIPSKQDIETTSELARSLAIADIKLLDHMIVADNDYVSMRQTPMLAPLFHRTWR